jgi:hypothetical protein
MLNPKFVILLAAVYGFFNWILDFNAGIALDQTLAHALRQGGLEHAIRVYWAVLVPTSPWSALLVLISGFAYTRFADSPYSAPLKWAMGLGHALLQAAVVTLTTIAAMRLTQGRIADVQLDGIVSVTLATLLSAIASATAFGFYLFFCIRFLGRHPNEGFSSMAIEDFKSFLRLRIGKDGALTIFPIGLETVPKNDDEGALDEQLIEPPIRIAP